MNNQKKRKIMVGSGISLMVISIVAFAWYEWFGGREWINYREILVLKEDVLQGEVISDDKLTVMEVDKKTIPDSVINNPNQILDKAARHFIPKQTPLHENFFEESELVLGDGEYVSKIPIDWTLSIPDTLRRGDEIIVYAATYDSEILKELQSPTVVVSSDNENASESGESVGIDDSVNSLPIGDEIGGPVPAVESSELKELFTTNVAYVRDGSNKEVITTSKVDRMDGSSSVSNIEVIVTTDELKKLEEQIKIGAKLIIMYSDREVETNTKKLADVEKD